MNLVCSLFKIVNLDNLNDLVSFYANLFYGFIALELATEIWESLMDGKICDFRECTIH